MTSEPFITIVQPQQDGAPPHLPLTSTQPSTGATTAQLQARIQTLLDKVEHAEALLAKPLNEILSDREKALDSAAAWDAFGAMWVLSQRAMRRVALDLAAQLQVSEAEVVARAMRYANEVLNGDEVDLHGSIAPAQMEHIARHRAHLRKQFRPGDAGQSESD